MIYFLILSLLISIWNHAIIDNSMKVYSLISFNVFKTNVPFSRQVIGAMIHTYDFVLLQEWVDSIPIKNSYMATTCTTFTLPFRGAQTGTAIISSRMPLSEKTLLSEGRELGFVTHKSMIINSYLLDEKEVLVINCHALNFVTTTLFKETIHAWVSAIKKDVPAIFAGDFNTWNAWRFDYLEQILEEHGFYYAHYDHNLILRLDHIFVRNVTLHKVMCHTHVHVSDHYPIHIEFSLST
jgi:endonuclease/exonuclease/phosphatase (EEP) superfamily protein YafD